jgi:hypothetical protein
MERACTVLNYPQSPGSMRDTGQLKVKLNITEAQEAVPSASSLGSCPGLSGLPEARW